MNERLRPIIQVYCESLAEQVAVLARLAGTGPPEPEACQMLCDTAHRMAGTAHSIGYPDLGMAVAELEAGAYALIGAPPALRAVLGQGVHGVIERIRAFAEKIRPEHSRLWDADAAGGADKRHGGYAASVLSDATVLVADDDLIVRQLVRTVLVDAGAKLTILAADGQSAVRECYPKQPTVVIADWRMAPMNGLELLSNIRSGYTHMRADTPFVLLTGMNEREALRRALAAGVDYFLIKPFTREALIRAIKIARERYAQARERFHDSADTFAPQKAGEARA